MGTYPQLKTLLAHQLTWKKSAMSLVIATLLYSNAVYAQESELNIQLVAQPLNQAVDQLAKQANVQLVYASDLLDRLSAPALSGTYAFEQGMHELLKGTDLKLAKRADGVWTIVAVQNQARDMGQLKTIDVNSIGGATIATDPNAVQLNPIIVIAEDDTVTENSGSYTTKAMSVATKMATSLKKTPRSVSVISNQQLKDQGLAGKNLEETLRYAQGITVDDTSSGVSTWTRDTSLPKIYSRGQQVTNLQIDGINYDLSGASSGTSTSARDVYNERASGLLSLPDMILYDHVEIVRGPNSVFSGNGTPSATVNMQRKRPLQQQQVILEGTTSSWDSNLKTGNYRGTVDISTPLPILDNRLKVRFLASQQDGAASFQDHYKSKRETLYGVAEFDFSKDTVAGISYSNEKTDSTGIPITNNLPRYHWGGDLGLPVRTNITHKDTYRNVDSESIQFYVNHKFSDHWQLKANANHLSQSLRSLNLRWDSSNINEDGSGARTQLRSPIDKKVSQNNFDIHIIGDTNILGIESKILLGYDLKKLNGRLKNDSDYVQETYESNIFDYDWMYYSPGSYDNYQDIVKDEQFEHAVYGSIRLNLTDKASIIASGRKAKYQNESKAWVLNTSTGKMEIEQSSTIDTGKISQPFIPTYAFSYDFTKNLTAYISYSESYQDQSTLLTGTLLNPDNPKAEGSYTIDGTVKPATGKSYELGVNGEFFDGRLNSNATIFYTKRVDIANYANFGPEIWWGTTDELNGRTCCYFNNGEQQSKGIDIGISGEVYDGLQLSAGYTYNKNETKSAFNNLSYEAESIQENTHTRTPEHLFKFFASYQPQGKLEDWRFGLGAVIQSSSFSRGRVAEYLGYDEDYIWTYPDGTPTGSIGRNVYSNESYYANGANGGYNSGSTYTLPFEFTQGGYATWNGMIDWQATKNLSLTFNANNIFDKRYYRTIGTSTYGNYYGEPRNFSLTARLKF